MARLQILELPEGAGDERPQFVLVIDQADEATIASLQQQATRQVDDPAMYHPVAEQVGARAVLVFEEIIDIPANDQTPTPAAEQGVPPGSTYRLVIDGQPLTWEPAEPGSQKE